MLIKIRLYFHIDKMILLFLSLFKIIIFDLDFFMEIPFFADCLTKKEKICQILQQE